MVHVSPVLLTLLTVYRFLHLHNKMMNVKIRILFNDFRTYYENHKKKQQKIRMTKSFYYFFILETWQLTLEAIFIC